MNYNKFEKLVGMVKHQFLIHTKDGQNYFIMLRKDIYFNMVGVIATNEKSFAIEIIKYEDIEHCIVDSKKYE